MGSICGIYQRNGEALNPQLSCNMMKELSINPADSSDTWQLEGVFLGNCLQNLTNESLFEKIPYFHRLSNLVITRDAIIDNREEIYSLLDLADERLEEIPDNILILYAYRKWGRECPTYLLGDFAFAIFDSHCKEMFCAVDHTGNRTLYYYSSPKIFAFATLIKPLLALEQVSRQYSEEWICDFLSIPSVVHQLDSELTLYRDVRMLPAGHSLFISKDRMVKRAYWTVEKQKELRFKSDGEYEEAFCHVLGQAIRSRIRGKKPIGIMLSGGLDSASIACLASDELKKKNKQLYAFTSIPIEGYDGAGLSRKRVADETPYIETIKEGRENIVFNYYSFPGRHSLSKTKHYFAVLEQPYKIFENLFWMDGILDEAENLGVGTMLTGGVGNTTISYGNFSQCSLSLFLSGKWIKLLQEAGSYSSLKKRHPTKLALELAKSLVPYEVQKLWRQRRDVNWDKPFDLSPVNPLFAQRIRMEDRFKKFNYDPFYQKKLDAFKHRKKMFSPYHLSHLGAVYTKIALSHNMIIRDPAIDKRVIEFCLSVPVEQFIRKGQDRSLIRRAMAGILPDKIRLNDQVRGLQSADYLQRLLPFEKEIQGEIMGIGQVAEERKFLDIRKISEQGKNFSLTDPKALSNLHIRMLLRSIIFSRFLSVDR